MVPQTNQAILDVAEGGDRRDSARLEHEVRAPSAQSPVGDPETNSNDAGLTARLVAAFEEGEAYPLHCRSKSAAADVMDFASCTSITFSQMGSSILDRFEMSRRRCISLATGIDPSDVGLRGEYTAAVLDLHKGKRIRYLPTSSFQSPDVKPITSMRTLEGRGLRIGCSILGVAGTRRDD